VRTFGHCRSATEATFLVQWLIGDRLYRSVLFSCAPHRNVPRQYDEAKVSVLDTLFLASVRFCIHVFSAGLRLRQEAVMPILLWYLPFAVFSGACDLLFAEPEVQVNERPADFDHAGPEKEATRH
jgi:lipid-A-disaccharide synthase-like uncharacterized protein